MVAPREFTQLELEYLCIEEHGAHDYEPTSDWHQPVNPEGDPTAIAEYRDVKCSRCGAVAVEAQAPAEGIAEKVNALQDAEVISE